MLGAKKKKKVKALNAEYEAQRKEQKGKPLCEVLSPDIAKEAEIEFTRQIEADTLVDAKTPKAFRLESPIKVTDDFKAAFKADIAVIVVADDKSPALLSAIEDGWAVVNVKKLNKGLSTPEDKEKFLNDRCQKEVLASFAVPGAPAGLRNTTEDEIRAALTRKVEATAEDSIEARQVKAMVEGMKNELRNFLAAGGSIRQYGRRLVQRQDEEISYFTRAQNEINHAAARDVPREQLIAEWEKANERLRRMGIGSVPMPKQKEK